MADSKEMELKAYKMLAELRSSMLERIRHEARNRVEYPNTEPNQSVIWMEYISNPAKWDHCGLLRKEDIAVMETLEYLLNDEMKENPDAIHVRLDQVSTMASSP